MRQKYAAKAARGLCGEQQRKIVLCSIREKGCESLKFRHEWKHEINHADMLVLRARLAAVMKADSHALDGTYEVSSLYFDDMRDRALQDKINGVGRREKFRLRYYNRDASFILLEKKSKIDGLCHKVSVPLSASEARAVINCEMALLSENEKPLVQELYFKMQTKGIRPKTIVEYTRDAFVYAPGNVRVTLDYNIRTGLRRTDFLNPAGATVPAGGAVRILEVKWDEFLPEVIRDIVWLRGRHSTAFSKYAVCRIYG